MNELMTDGTWLKDLLVIKNNIFVDQRGFLIEQYSKKKIPEIEFVQDNFVFSVQNTLRGLHFQKEHPQGKLITVGVGAIYDVAVDLREDSPTYRKWFSKILSDAEFTQIYIPPGFAHGFIALTDSYVMYKCTDYYYPDDQHGYIWNDKTLNINWNLDINPDQIILSEKDKSLPSIA